MIFLGVRYEFSCSACGYKTVISGERDRGLRFGTVTITCKDCKELYDVRVTEENEHPSKVFDPKWKLPPLYCPKSKDHSVKEWNHPDKCPKCGEKIERGPGVLEWD